MNYALALISLALLSACGEQPRVDALTQCCGPDAVNCYTMTEVSQDSSRSWTLYLRKDGSNECSVRVQN
jgi:hypothetical protein